jgi:cell division protein FtsW (lipid II flippase)
MKKLFIMPLPAIMIGALAMYRSNVPIAIWGQNFLGLVIAFLLSNFLIRKTKIINNNFTMLITITLLLFSFMDSGLEGVHRWISFGLIRFYVTSILLPVLIIKLWETAEKYNIWISTFITILVSVIITLQPDASQATAFVIPMSLILCPKINNNYLRYIVLGLFSLIVIWSWLHLDTLSPVPYVENIVKMVANMGIGWLILGIISLVMLPLPFIIFPPEKNKSLSICLGIYYTTILLSTMFGNFPVPLMGYGVSPILGYFIGLTWLVNSKIDSLNKNKLNDK